MPLLQLHGPPQLALDDGRVVTLALREAALLAWLHLEGPTPRGPIAGRLWPGGGDARARTNLRQLLARLRRVAPVLQDADTLLALAPGLAVSTAADGPLLGTMDFDDAPDLADWLAARRAHDQRERIHQQLAAGAAAFEAGDTDAALAAAHAVLALEPTIEEAHRLRMTTLAARGDRAAAVGAWDDCRTALWQAYGIRPSAATNALGQRLLVPDEDAPVGTALPPALRRPARLVGRAALLRLLGDALEADRSLVLTGPGGIGKSRVVAALAAGRPGCLPVAAQLGDRDDIGALLRRVLQAALSQHAPTLPARLAADLDGLRSRLATLRSGHEHRQALEAGRLALEACVARGLTHLAIEDLHHADAASLDALARWAGHWLAAGAAPSPRLLLTARRDELDDAGERLVAALTGQQAVLHHALLPLSPQDVAAMLADLPDDPGRPAFAPPARPALAQALVDTVGGNPAFLLEAVRHLWTGGVDTWQPGRPLPWPSTLADAVGERLRRLPPEVLQLAQLAAIAESDFTPELAAAATGRPILALGPPMAALESAQVFADGRLMHDLIARAVQASVPGSLVAPLHRLVAEQLQRREGRASRIAHHLDLAGDGRAAADWHRRAGESARRQWQPAEAARAHERAAVRFDPGRERPLALAAWLDAAAAWLLCEDVASTGRALDAARPLLVHPEERVMWLARESRRLHQTHERARWLEASGELAALLERHRARLTTAELAQALREVCTAIQGGAPAAPMIALCEDAAPTMLAAPGDEAATWAWAYGVTLHWLGRSGEAVRLAGSVWRRLDERNEPSARLSLLNLSMRARHTLGELPAAVADGRTLLALAERSPLGVVVECDVLHVVGTMLTAQGLGAQGLACFGQVAARLDAAGQPMREVFAVSWSLACLSCGQHARARELLDAIPRGLDEPLNVVYDQGRAWALARLALAEGRSPDPWIARLQALSGLPPALDLVHRVGLATLRTPDAVTLRALYDSVAEPGFRALERCMAVVIARDAARRGALDEARRMAERAWVLADCVDAWIDHPASLWPPLQEVFLACGETARADEALARGAAWVRAGAAQWVRDEDRRAWLQDQPVHAELLARADAGAREV